MAKKVLFTSTAGFGHIHPTVPLARAMVARGHDVLWATPEDGVPRVERAGIRAVSAAPAGLARPAELLKRFPELAVLAPLEAGDVTFGKLFGTMAAPAMLAGLAGVATDWRPDLVVADAAEFAGHIVAAELGIPSVTKGFGPQLPERRIAGAGEEVAPLWRSRGLEPRPYGGAYEHLYLDIYPPALRSPGAMEVPRRQLLRPVADDGQLETFGPPPLPDARSGAPLVYVTMGTVFNNPEPFEMILSALDQLGARALVTVGPQADPTFFGPQPEGVRIERYVPQRLVLPHCDAVVSHAGSGTVLASLTFGVPQLCIPQGADQYLNAWAVASAGAGISLMPGEVTQEAVRDGVARLLDDAAYRDSAGRVASSISSMPSPDDVAAVLEDVQYAQATRIG
jgi:UDP:flavonoid glycosyltransferase YjiC (YdhE family)